MKKLISIILALVMLLALAGCTMVPGADSSAVASAIDEVPAVESVAEPEPENSTGLPGNRNPLTGEETEKDISGYCPVAVMLNNIKQALPQSGNSKADFFYEIPEEGGITRIMALYQDIKDVGVIGTVRSTRPYYVRLAVGQDAVLVHCGGSKTAYYIIKKYMRKADFNDMDCLSKGTNCAYSYFYRSQARLNAGYATEHTMYTDSDKILSYFEQNPDVIRTKHRKKFDCGLRFAEDGMPVNGASAKDIDVVMSQYKNTTFQYDPESKTYAVGQFGSGYMDEVSGEQVKVTNVIIIQTDISVVQESKKGHLSVILTGTGSGYYACGGKYIPIKWEKKDVKAPQKFYDMDGNELKLGVGKTFVCVIDKSRDITIDSNLLEKPSDANAEDNNVDNMALAG